MDGHNSDFDRNCDYLELACENIALLTVHDMRSSIFSRGRVCVLDKDGNEIEDDPFLAKIANPNYADSQSDFLYKHLFFKGIGNNYTRIIHRNKSKDVDSIAAMMHLIPSEINHNEINKFNEFILSKSDKKKAKEREIEYTLGDKVYKIPLDELIMFYDISSGLTADSYFRSPSKIDALLPDLRNIEEAQKAKNINLKFSSKFIVSGKQQQSKGEGQWVDTVFEPEERDDIENKVYHKDILVNPNGLEVHSLANDFRNLMYDTSMANDFLRVTNTWGVNKEIISWFAEGQDTYSNKKEAVVGWIQNSIMFEAEDFGNSYANYLGYTEEGKKIVLKYDHLPIMRAYQEEAHTKSQKNQIEIAKGLMDLGLTMDEALKKAGIKEM